MARKIITQLVDDIDGTVLEIGDGETVLFSLDGVTYEVDLSTVNAGAFRDAFAPYVSAGRRVSSSRQSASSPTRSFRAAGGENATIRKWAAANGHPISPRGRIPENVVAMHHAAH